MNKLLWLLFSVVMVAAGCSGSDDSELKALTQRIEELEGQVTTIPATSAATAVSSTSIAATTTTTTTTTIERITFTSDRYGDAEIFVMNADGTQVHQLTNSPTHQLTNNNRFSTDPA